MEEKILLTNIQRFSLHDGPGIRTTVFLKGCYLRCPWCANPENISFIEQSYCKEGKIGVFGKYMTAKELYSAVIRDRDFYLGELEAEEWNISLCSLLDSLPGGVSFSGGEPLAQAKELLPLLQRLKSDKVHVVVETSLYVPESQLRTVLDYVNLFYVDMKIIDKKCAAEIVKGNIDLYKSNLQLLLGSDKPVVIRIPFIGGMTDTESNRINIIEILKEFRNRILKVEIIKEHSLGREKYISLGLNSPEYKGVSEELMLQFKNDIEEETGIATELCII